MSQERWDVVLWFPEGPLSLEGDIVCRGPVVRMGANPGPGGLSLSGYRGLDDRQATITAYGGDNVAVAPVGNNQVRLAPHPNVDWSSIQPIRAPAFLTKGCAFHLGPPARGVTAHFIECRRLGTWEQERLLSDAADGNEVLGNPETKPSEVKELRTDRGIPWWFPAGLVFIGSTIALAIVVPLVGEYQKSISLLGPIDRGEVIYEIVNEEVILDETLLEGFNQAWADFVQRPGATKAGRPELVDTLYWDQKLLDYTTRSAQQHLGGWRFWMRLEQIREDYAYVTAELRSAGMPEAIAGIPFTESQYRAEIQNGKTCAKGWWQFMPETANRLDIEIRDCKFKGRNTRWTPKGLAPPNGLNRNADYVEDGLCIIPPLGGCDVDQRQDLAVSTRGAIESLKEAWDDPWIAASGAAVQITIASHHGGYDDSRYLDGKVKSFNLLPAYRKWLEKNDFEFDPKFVGSQIACKTLDDETKGWCGSRLDRYTQHYTYKILAQHFLAVCYYGANYSEDKRFEPWKQYTRGDGYCTRIKVPTREQVEERL